MLAKVPEILVIDDIISAADEYAELIRVSCAFQVTTTNDPKQAQEIVAKYPIKVLVIDQAMPEMKGTDLFQKIKKINPEIKAVMLSGEAKAAEVGEAMKLGYIFFLEKSKISELPSRVLELYAQYEVDFSKRFIIENCPVVHDGNWLTRIISTNLKYRLVSTQILNDEFVFKEQWKTVARVNAGEKKTTKETLQFEIGVIMSEEVESQVLSELNLEDQVINLFKAKLSSEIKSKFNISKSLSRTQSFSREVENSLPSEPTDPNVVYVASRTYETAPVFLQIRCLIVRECPTCKHHYPFPIVVYQQTSKMATRQTNYLSDGNTNVLETGIHNYL